MNDFKKIRKLPEYSKIRSLDLSVIHHRSRKWLGESLENFNFPNVVITHHAPSINSVSEEYRNDLTASAYASNMEGFIKKYGPKLWLHGHLHTSSDYQIEQWRVVCNPRGHKGENNPHFTNEKIIHLN